MIRRPPRSTLFPTRRSSDLTYSLMENSNINFIGNVEGRDLFSGECDVLVCDGLVGNVALKVSESTAHAIVEMLKKEIKSDLLSIIGILLAKRSFNALKKKMAGGDL